MTKLLNLSLTFLMATSFPALRAQASEIQYGSSCGFIDEADNFELADAKTQYPQKASELSAIQKKQMIVAANSEEDLTGAEALHELIENSEGGDLDYTTGTFNGKVYDMIRSYPGGNPVATIFEHDSIKPVATISDSDLMCVTLRK